VRDVVLLCEEKEWSRKAYVVVVWWLYGGCVVEKKERLCEFGLCGKTENLFTPIANKFEK
jgi:hypothetical protein